MTEDPEVLADQAWKEMEKALPFREFVRTWGPLVTNRWIARLHRDSTAQLALQTLLDKTGFVTANKVGRAQLDEVLSFIEGHPTLKKHVRTTYRLQLAHTMRAALFGGDALRAPAVKSAEWKALHDRLSAILPSPGRDTFYLVDDEVGEPGHKIELNDLDLLTPDFIRKLQAALRGWKNDWYVVVTLDPEHPDVDPGLIVVWEDHVDEVLDRDQWKAALGDRFRI